MTICLVMSLSTSNSLWAREDWPCDTTDRLVMECGTEGDMESVVIPLCGPGRAMDIGCTGVFSREESGSAEVQTHCRLSGSPPALMAASGNSQELSHSNYIRAMQRPVGWTQILPKLCSYWLGTPYLTSWDSVPSS